MLKECKFCGQMINVESEETEGYELCGCGAARAEIFTQEQIEEACQNVEILFGEECGDFGFAPVREIAVVETLKTLCALVASGAVGAVSMTITGSGVAMMKLGSKGEVKVTRRVTNANTLNAAAAH